MYPELGEHIPHVHAGCPSRDTHRASHLLGALTFDDPGQYLPLPRREIGQGAPWPLPGLCLWPSCQANGGAPAQAHVENPAACGNQVQGVDDLFDTLVLRDDPGDPDIYRFRQLLRVGDPGKHENFRAGVVLSNRPDGIQAVLCPGKTQIEQTDIGVMRSDCGNAGIRRGCDSHDLMIMLLEGDSQRLAQQPLIITEN